MSSHLAAGKAKEAFRDYRADARPGVREFYRLNHRHQTLAFVLAKKAEYLPPRRRQMSVWEALEFLDTLVDDSDPDTELSQIEHLMQTAEAIRAAGQPRWFILTGLVHDLGKVLCLFGEPQWAVVGDTFPVGCAFSERVVFPEFFADNPDSAVPEYQTPCGIYAPGCGLDNVHLSWGYDESSAPGRSPFTASTARSRTKRASPLPWADLLASVSFHQHSAVTPSRSSSDRSAAGSTMA
jgi:inositol oxygenase